MQLGEKFHKRLAKIRIFYLQIIFILLQHQNKKKEILIMARPIADTPILKGKDAKRFREAMENVQPLPPKNREKMKEAYELLKQRSNFYLP